MKSQHLLLSVLFACLLITSCGKDGPNNVDPEPEPNPNMVSKDIGTSGGKITSKDGNLTLDIPAGALSGTETITITPIDHEDLGDEFDVIADSIGIAAAYELGPDGLTFTKPVTVTIPSDQKALQPDGSLKLEAELLLTTEPGKVAALDSLQLVSAGDGALHITGELSHFSPLVQTSVNFGSNITTTITGVPDVMEIGETVQGLVVVQHSAFYNGLDVYVSILDEFPFPTELENTGFGTYTATLNITCSEEGKMNIEFLVAFLTESGYNIAYEMVLAKTVTCVKPAIEIIITDFSLISDLPLGTTLKAEIKYGKSMAELDGSINWGDGATDEATIEVNDEGTATIEEKHTYGTAGEKEVTLTLEDPETGATAEESDTVTVAEPPPSDNLPTGVYDPGGILARIEAAFHIFFGDSPYESDFSSNKENLAQEAEGQFGGLSGNFMTIVAGTEGLVVIDLLTQEVLLEVTDNIKHAGPFFGAFGMLADKNDAESSAEIVAYGANGRSSMSIRDKRVTTYNSNTNYIWYDGMPAGGNIYANIYMLVSPEDGIIFRLPFNNGTINDIKEGNFEDELVSAWLASDEGGAPIPLLAIDRAVVSGLYYKDDIVDGNAIKRIADLGLDARKIRCIATNESGFICAVTLFGDDEIAIITWTGEDEPVVVGTAPAGDGPVDLGLALLENGNIAIVTTGFNDNTVTETEVSPDGTVVSNVTRPVLDGCINPGHAIYVRDGEGLKIVGTCYTSGNYFIMKSGF